MIDAHDGTDPTWARRSAVAALIASCLAAVAFYPAVIDMVGRWQQPNGYYGHGPFVLLGAAVVAWQRRSSIASQPPGSSGWGLVAFIALSPLFFVALLEDMRFLQNFVLLGVITAGVLVFLGAARARLLAFPLAFLAFAVPLPNPVIDMVTFRLKLVAARVAVEAVQLAGGTALLRGSTIHFATESVVVDDVCSGLRTLVTLVALAVFLAHRQPTRWRAAVMVAAAIPVALLANVVRILALCGLAVMGSRAAVEGPLHEATGLGVYALALALLLGIQALCDRASSPTEFDPAPQVASPDVAAPRPPAPGAAAPRASLGRLATFVALVAPLAAGTLALLILPPPVPFAEQTRVTSRIPAEIGRWHGTDVPLEAEVPRLLGTQDILLRRYQRAGERGAVDVYVVYASGDIFRVAHPPERCFQGGGFEPRERAVVTLPAADHRVAANRFLFQRDQHTVLVYYWYRLNGRDVSSYVDYRFGSFLDRLQRRRSGGCMIRLSTTVDRDGVAAAERRLTTFAAEALRPVLAPIP